MNQNSKYKIKEYVSFNGMNYFRKWLNTIVDVKCKARIQARLFRAELGNLGDCKFLGCNIMEMRLSFASGYRIYFGLEGKQIILLLIGGDKSTQNRDILKAKQLWEEYKRRK